MSSYSEEQKGVFFFIAKVKLDVYKEIITTEEQSPFEQTSENSSVQTAHTQQEGEHVVLVLSRVPVSLSDVCRGSELSSVQLTKVQSL